MTNDLIIGYQDLEVGYFFGILVWLLSEACVSVPLTIGFFNGE